MAQSKNKLSFRGNCYLSGREIQKVNNCLKSLKWSSFKGANEGWDIDKCLQLNSIEASKIGDLDVRFLGGKYVRKLESEIAKKFKINFAVTANSATSALVMAVGSLNIEPGDEIIVPSMSYIASATCILSFSAIPIFCEVKENTFCMDPLDLEKKITKKTKAIIVVHLGGAVADLKKILKIAKKYNLKIIEDAAQAPGVKYKNKYVGTYGDVGVFSFTETKTITCGEGGVLITNNLKYAQKARLIRNHGESVTKKTWSKEKLINVIGMNYRLTEIQAVILIEQLKSLDKRNSIRVKNFEYLKKKLSNFKELIQPETEKNSNYIPYIVKWKIDTNKYDRNLVLAGLKKYGIPVSSGYEKMMHENEIFVKKIAYGSGNYPWALNKKKYNYGKGTLPVSENINKKFIWFKFINPPNTLKHMDYVVHAFKKIFI